MPVVAALERRPRARARRRVSGYGSRPRNGLQLAEQVAHAARAVDGEPRLLAAAQGERLQHPGQAEEVVGVQVREEDLLELRQADGRALELPLRSLGAVEEQPLAAAPEEERRRRAPRGRHRRRGAEEDEVEIHAGDSRSRSLRRVGSARGRRRRSSSSTGARSRRSSTRRSATCTRRTRSPRTRATCPGSSRR